MKRVIVLLGALAMLAMLASPAAAVGGPPMHGHVLLIGADFTANPAYPGEGPPYFIHGFDKCVDLANGNALKLQAHHDTVHQGRAGEALRSAGHIVVPLSPLTGFTSCADIEAAFAS